jgi:hypothetical protein
MTKLRWQDVVNLLLGLWIGTSPWVLGFAGNYDAAMWNAAIVGGIILVLSALDIDLPAYWEEWLLIALGAWLALSPSLFGFTAYRIGAINTVASGIVVAVLAAWALFAATRPGAASGHVTDH